MDKFIDIHTHRINKESRFAVSSLNVNEAVDFLSNKEKQFCSVGIHPWHILDSDINLFDKMEELVTDKSVVAIGECGLDKNSKASIKQQTVFFERQILISEKYKKPLIIHCVRSFNEIIALKKRYNPTQTWIIHGFKGKPELAKQLIDSGLSLSFGEKFNPLSVAVTPIDKIFVETDESNLPIEDIYQQVALAKHCQPKEITAGFQLLRS